MTVHVSQDYEHHGGRLGGPSMVSQGYILRHHLVRDPSQLVAETHYVRPPSVWGGSDHNFARPIRITHW